MANRHEVQTYDFGAGDPERQRAISDMVTSQQSANRLPPVSVNLKAWGALIATLVRPYADAIAETQPQWKHWQGWSAADWGEAEEGARAGKWTKAGRARWAPWPGNPTQPYPERPWSAMPGVSSAEAFAFLQPWEKLSDEHRSALTALIRYMAQNFNSNPRRTFSAAYMEANTLRDVVRHELAADARNALELWGWTKTYPVLTRATDGFPTGTKAYTHLTLPRYLLEFVGATGAGNEKTKHILKIVQQQRDDRFNAGSELVHPSGKLASVEQRIELFHTFPEHIQVEILEQGTVLNSAYGGNPALIRRERRNDPKSEEKIALLTKANGLPELWEDAFKYVWQGINEASKNPEDRMLLEFLRDQRKARKEQRK